MEKITISQGNESGEHFRIIHHADGINLESLVEVIKQGFINSTDLLIAICQLCDHISESAPRFGSHAAHVKFGTIGIVFNPHGVEL